MNLSVSENELLAKTIKKLNESGKTVATAESCTGGLLATYLTEISGSSQFYLGGVSCYSNLAKEKILNIPRSTMEQEGAVSQKVCELLAEQVRTLLAADFGLSVTGIAGPLGGSLQKPVGTVWCALSTKDKTESFVLNLSGTRQTIRQTSAFFILNKLYDSL